MMRNGKGVDDEYRPMYNEIVSKSADKTKEETI